MAETLKKSKRDLTTGFGTRSTDYGGRFYRKDGSVNVIRHGVPLLDRFSWFHTLLSMKRWKFYLILFTVYITVNLFFGIIYFFIGIEYLDGLKPGSVVANFAGAFFFSAQTFTTVGYGHISPIGFLTSAVATFEAFIGLLSFALASGLFYGRFAKPRPYLYFSDIALISPYKNGRALMFRTVPYKNNQLTDAEVKLTIGMRIKEGEEVKNVFYPLKVEFDKINNLVLNWTIVHPITEESPLYGLSMDQLKELKAEVLVFLKAYDEVFANNVIARTSYTAQEIIENAKFKPMYHSAPSGNATLLNISELNDFELLDLK
ncbi:MAG: Inward rectifier potassium channel Irk [Flavisolibacter sp.]|nr:Inward rectifier potassium channel Irk [Flavisolibacter sp.]